MEGEEVEEAEEEKKEEEVSIQCEVFMYWC